MVHDETQGATTIVASGTFKGIFFVAGTLVPMGSLVSPPCIPKRGVVIVDLAMVPGWTVLVPIPQGASRSTSTRLGTFGEFVTVGTKKNQCRLNE
mmetsp:Transcript_8522/g.17690  ORF Transcript_8522/g.17690 Transcript_8522/m.17690 type:complete len:95 (+) Transcript_8522:278-562(+)